MCKVNCPYDFMGRRLCVLQMLKLKANVLLHHSLLSYVCLRMPPLKIKMVPLTFNVVQLTIPISPSDFPQNFSLPFKIIN